MMSWCDIVSFENNWNVITSPCRTVRVGPGSVMLFAVHPQPAGAAKLPYNGIVTAPAGLGPTEGAARERGAANTAATTASPSTTSRIVFENPCMFPSSEAASHSPRINVFRNGPPRGEGGQITARAVYHWRRRGAGDGTSRFARSARGF